MHPVPSRRAALAVFAAAALTVLVGAAFSSPATADATIDPLQQALTERANCQVLLAHSTPGTAQYNRARNCIADQTVIINALTVTPSPSGSVTPPPPGPSPTPTATPTPVPTTPAPTPSPTQTSSGWPDASSTGVPAGTLLTPHGSTTIDAAWVTTNKTSVIDGWDIQGYLDIRAANVTVRNSRVRCASDGSCLHSYSTGLLVQRVDIGPAVLNTAAAGIAVMDGNPSSVRNRYLGLNIHNVGDGLRCDGGIELADSWVHDLGFGGGLHGDACQATDTDSNPDPGNLWFHHNRMDGGNTSVFLIQGNPSNILIDGNLLRCVSASGEQTSYITNVGAQVPQGGVVFRNNVIVGTAANTGCQAGIDGSSSNYQWTSTTWAGNTYTDGTVATPVVQ